MGQFWSEAFTDTSTVRQGNLWMAWWEPQTWDWATMTKTAIGAGFGTALVQGLLAIYRDRRDRKLQAAYMAMRLAVVL